MSRATDDRENDCIDPTNAEHMEYWTKEFGITADTLRMLIARHGSLASEIRLVLGK
jgi:Protein of unknown function (DUF3606)